MTRSLPFLLVAILLVTGCGRVGTLKRADGKTTIPVAAGATRAQTADELLHPGTQSRPQRNVDILYRSEKRAEDPFELPPGPDNGRPR